MVIKRIAPVSCAKMTGTLYALLGLIIGACVSLFALAGGLAGHAANPSTPVAALGISAIVGVGSIVLFPLIYGAMGFFGALIMAVLYNLLASMVGGVRIEVE